MNEVTDLTIGSDKKKVTIVNTEIKPCSDLNPNKRFFIYTQSTDGAEYKINEVWVKDHTGTLVPKSLWLNFDHTGEQLLSTSLLARIMQFLNVNAISEMIGKEIVLKPKPNGFMAMIAFDQ